MNNVFLLTYFLCRYLFIADSSRIVRTNMDGTNFISIVRGAIHKASGVGVDVYGKRIYWCDNLLDQIETADYEGKHRWDLILFHLFIFTCLKFLWKKNKKYIYLFWVHEANILTNLTSDHWQLDFSHYAVNEWLKL